MSSPVKLLSIGTAVPPYRIDQRDAAAAHQGFASRFPDFEQLARVFESSGIKSRYAVRPLDWYLTPLGWPERTAAFVDGASELFVDAAETALRAADVRARDVDVVVTVSSTGITTPSLEAKVAGRMGFRPDVERVPVFGLGCAGGVTGLSIGSRFAQARPGCVVLVVAVEACTLAFRLDELTKSNIVATALFGDGAGACVLRAGTGGIASVEMSGQYTWPDTLDIMGWRIDPTGLGVIFARSIPPFAQANLRPAMDSMLAAQGLDVDDVDRFICHPGGVKVIEALEHSLSIGQGQLDHERTVLADHGNMSAPTVLFVLDRARHAGLPATSVVSALGPGFTASTVTLKRAA